MEGGDIMFSLFKRKPKIATEDKLARWKNGATQYIKECQSTPLETTEPKIKFSLRTPGVKKDNDDSIKYQRKKTTDGGDIKYSSRSTGSDIKYSDRSPDPDIRYSLSLDDSFEADKANTELYSVVKNASVTKTTFTTAKTFTQTLLAHIDSRGLKDSTVYRAANLDKRLFSKIASDIHYKPSKETAIALALGLQLTLDETNDLLSRAGYQLSHSIRRDIIIEYFIREREYSIININEVLDRLGEKIIGR